MSDAFKGQNRDAFFFSIKFSAAAAAVGVVFGALLAYAAATARAPASGCATWSLSFSGVAANLGGIPLAFAFLALLGRQGVLTKIITEGPGTTCTAHGFGFDTGPA